MPTEVVIDTRLKFINPTIIHYKTIDSTNAYLLGEHSHPGGTVIWADYQSSGQGRRGRRWQAPAEQALLFSIYWEHDKRKAPLHIFTFLAAVGVFEGLQQVLNCGDLALKWPNDVLLERKKICGILVQSKNSHENRYKLVIGIGVNINQPPAFFRDDLKQAGSLFSITGRRYDRVAVLRKILMAIDNGLIALDSGGADEILQRWKEYCPFIGCRIRVDTGEETWDGLFEGVGAAGNLILNDGRVRRLIHAADVSILNGE